MPNWLKSMQQTFEYFVVDPGTWRDVSQLRNVRQCTISRDDEAETLGSATIDISGSLDECYIRVYLVTIQNGIRERHPLGTFLVQTPSYNYNGKLRDSSLDAYTPLLELKENPPPLGYSVLKGENIMGAAYRIARDHARAPIVATECDKTLEYDFVANTNDRWITFLSDLISNAKYEFSLDELGRILFAPVQELESLQPVWTYNDDNSSILQPEVSVDRDLYGIPNVVEVVYSKGIETISARVVNDDSNSPTSTVRRGREIIQRITDPDMVGLPTQEQIQEYAERALKELSSIEYTVTYTHGYCPVRLGDCVRLNYSRAELNGIKAKVVSQSIQCKVGCPVTEKAVFTKKLWR